MKSQAKVDTIVPLYNPKPDDQLIITWDWCEKKRAIGAILWAINEDKKHVCGYYSLMLDKTVKNCFHPPCPVHYFKSKIFYF